jgi:hypothetical protein
MAGPYCAPVIPRTHPNWVAEVALYRLYSPVQSGYPAVDARNDGVRSMTGHNSGIESLTGVVASPGL